VNLNNETSVKEAEQIITHPHVCFSTNSRYFPIFFKKKVLALRLDKESMKNHNDEQPVFCQ
jgi:hypothetical protein